MTQTFKQTSEPTTQTPQAAKEPHHLIVAIPVTLVFILVLVIVFYMLHKRGYFRGMCRRRHGGGVQFQNPLYQEILLGTNY